MEWCPWYTNIKTCSPPAITCFFFSTEVLSCKTCISNCFPDSKTFPKQPDLSALEWSGIHATADSTVGKNTRLGMLTVSWCSVRDIVARESNKPCLFAATFPQSVCGRDYSAPDGEMAPSAPTFHQSGAAGRF